jgi:plastocyanin
MAVIVGHGDGVVRRAASGSLVRPTPVPDRAGDRYTPAVMKRGAVRRGGATVAMLAALTLPACGNDDKPVQTAVNPSTTRITSPVTSAVPTSTPVPNPIVIKDFSYSGLEVKAGAALVIQNQDNIEHTLTADDKSFDSGHVPAKGSLQFKAPTTTGTYKIHCEVHPTRMMGELKVT